MCFSCRTIPRPAVRITMFSGKNFESCLQKEHVNLRFGPLAIDGHLLSMSNLNSVVARRGLRVFLPVLFVGFKVFVCPIREGYPQKRENCFPRYLQKPISKIWYMFERCGGDIWIVFYHETIRATFGTSRVVICNASKPFHIYKWR
jgi:hypothetical protein